MSAKPPSRHGKCSVEAMKRLARKQTPSPTRAIGVLRSEKKFRPKVRCEPACGYEMPGKRRVLVKSTPVGAVLEQLEKTKAGIRAKAMHPFRVIKRQFGFVMIKYRGMAKNTANLVTLFALSNLWMARKGP